MKDLIYYIPPLIAFAAALIALTGKPKWNPEGRGLRKLTVPGRLTAGVAFLALLFSIAIIYIAQRSAEWEEEQRKAVEDIAHTELKAAICEMALPLLIEVSGARGLGMTDCAMLWARVDMLDLDTRNALGAIDLNAVSPFERIADYNPRWGKAIEDCADRGFSEIDRVKATYSAYLQSGVLVQLYKIQHHGFMEMLRNLDVYVTGERGLARISSPQTIDPLSPRLVIATRCAIEMSSFYGTRTELEPRAGDDETPYPFGRVLSRSESLYEDFWRMIAELEVMLTTQTDFAQVTEP